MEKVSELIIYKNIENGEALQDMAWIMENYDNEYYNVSDIKALLYDNVNRLIEMAEQYGFEGNVWHNYLAFLLANNENAYSTACEVVGEVEGTINEVALNDFRIFGELMKFDFKKLEEKLSAPCLLLLENYKGASSNGKVFNKRIRDRICELSVKLSRSNDEFEFKEVITSFYKDFGVGKLGLHKAFRITHENNEPKLVPITNICHVHLDDLVGYELQKKKLIDNTEAFVSGKKANNCLLFGDAGTGKSTSVKAILNEYYDRGLRMIEIYKHQFQDLTSVIAQIKNRNYKFIIFMDDLSFEEFEIEYKYLKAVIEGGLEKRPDNVLIYATSNRRHLVREKFSDKEERRDDLHSSDTVQEKLSLAYRFGVSIFFVAPEKKEYMKIVDVLAKRHGLEMPQEELFMEANRWELYHGGLSGRTAQQFIDYLLGRY
ncbi:ATP-binding protein [Konateibacter massiliensis]|uniref:ATP-binding protein n=1 Tax=Konateibacter massiliensis TaxID=2002841 RepID=UPI000C1461EA|nr:ATP-binding protein [Konateibacter massiliensis]